MIAGLDLPAWMHIHGLHRFTGPALTYLEMAGLIGFFEWCYGKSVTRYLSGDHLHQVAWYFYRTTGLSDVIFFSWLYYPIYHFLPFLNLHIMDGKPLLIRFLVVLLVTDFVYYWIHRLRHVVPFLWTFHAVHHAAETLTPAQMALSHPLDDYLQAIAGTMMSMALGAEPALWTALAVLRQFTSFLQHSDLSWRFGPFYYVWVSPAFHRAHHGKAAELHNKNFAQQLSMWDFIFGTAANPAVVPCDYGVPGLRMRTLKSEMIDPFRTLYAQYRNRSHAAVRSAAAGAEGTPGS